jgi:prolyl-tRNA synthetase
MKWALDVTRAENFNGWYQAVNRAADLAETSPVRGCMVIRPWGYGIWELMQQDLDRRFKETGHENCYFPLFIPLSFIAKEAEHVEGFAKEMAVVTHHRLKMIDGVLAPDPEAKLTEPLIVRPTSETIIGDSFHRWIRSYRDLPVLLNQWANVVRWEMRTRLFLRTAEFLWQEGHTAHADRDDAFAETMRMLEVYRSFAEDVMAMPVVPGEKPENERFPGAENTFSIEAMMQDGKALQAGTSHYLGTHFAKAQDITYQSKDGKKTHVHTTSWGVSTRLIGGLIMTHGDDDGLRLPPALAPKQIVIVPIARGSANDGRVIDYCQALAATLRSQSWRGAPLRVAVDMKDRKAIEKRWDWVQRGAPLIAEIGERDVDSGNVSFFRRDALVREGERLKSFVLPKEAFLSSAAGILGEIQARLFLEAQKKRDDLIQDGLTSFADLTTYFGPGEKEDDDEGDAVRAPVSVKGWVRASWSKPTGAALTDVAARLKMLNLSIRVAPLKQPEQHRPCIFTGAAGNQEILISRAY